MTTSCDVMSCFVKPAVHLQVGNAHSDGTRSGVCIVDVTLPFGKPVNVQRISFKNFYTSSVSVRLLRKELRPQSRWTTAVRDLVLMGDPHTEDGAQDYCSIPRTQMLVDPDQVLQVRLILRQPSSAWLTFYLEDIKIYPQTEKDLQEEVSDWLSDLTLVDQHPDVENLPDSRSVSCSVQQMLALTEVMKNNQNSSSIGRYQVDSCYDINRVSL